MSSLRDSLAFLALVGLLAAPTLAGCVMQRTVTRDGAVVERGYVMERPGAVINQLENTGPDEDDD